MPRRTGRNAAGYRPGWRHRRRAPERSSVPTERPSRTGWMPGGGNGRRPSRAPHRRRPTRRSVLPIRLPTAPRIARRSATSTASDGPVRGASDRPRLSCRRRSGRSPMPALRHARCQGAIAAMVATLDRAKCSAPRHAARTGIHVAHAPECVGTQEPRAVVALMADRALDPAAAPPGHRDLPSFHDSWFARGIISTADPARSG